MPAGTGAVATVSVPANAGAGLAMPATNVTVRIAAVADAILISTARR